MSNDSIKQQFAVLTNLRYELIVDLKLDTSRAIISIEKRFSSSLAVNLTEGISKIFMSGSNAKNIDLMKSLFCLSDNKLKEILILALKLFNIYIICPRGYLQITFWAVPNSRCNSTKS